MNKVLFFAIVVMIMATVGKAYKPIIALHGFTGSSKVFDQMKAELEKAHPGQKFFALDIDNTWQSAKRIQTLIDNAAALMRDIIANNEKLFSEGFILLGQSQGGLVTRGVMEQHKWNITKYISTAGVQNGFFGDCGNWFGINLSCDIVTDMMYTKEMQNKLSIANFWRSPDRELYLKRNLCLPVLNNEEGVNTTPDYQKMQKDNFLQAKEYHFFGSPDDEILHPWYTSMFSFYDTDGVTRVPLEGQYIYKYDTFGLRTAIEQGRVHFYEVPGVKHREWVMGRTDIYYNYLFPLFD